MSPLTTWLFGRRASRLARGAGAAVAIAGAVLAAPLPAVAAAPSASGWWSEARQNSQAPSSSSVTQQAPAGTPVPASPGLEVQNTPAGPSAYAALRFTDTGTAGKLTLQISDSKSVNPPQLVLCLATSQWQEGAEQSWDTKPAYDCTKGKSTGQVTGSTVTFPVVQQLKTAPDTFDFVIVPDPGYQEPFQVQISEPSYDALQTTGGSDAGDSSVPPVTTPPSMADGAGSVGAPADTSAPSLPSDSAFAAPPPAGVVAPSVAGPETQAGPQNQGAAPVVANNQARPVAAGGSNHDGRTLGIGLIVGLALLLLVLMANPGAAASARRFSHPVLASMGAHAAAPDPEDSAGVAALTRSGHPLLLQGGHEPHVGGVGRFVKQRTRPPVRL